MKGDELDPKALIREAYRIEGISAPECRSIFMDWALGMPMDADMKPLIEALIARYGDARDHPMTGVLFEGLAKAAPPARRGGRQGRLGQGRQMRG